jgi:hypothetical protein
VHLLVKSNLDVIKMNGTTIKKEYIYVLPCQNGLMEHIQVYREVLSYFIFSFLCITTQLLQFESNNAHCFVLKPQCYNTKAPSCFGITGPLSGESAVVRNSYFICDACNRAVETSSCVRITLFIAQLDPYINITP